jgi:hypothetical protein
LISGAISTSLVLYCLCQVHIMASISQAVPNLHYNGLPLYMAGINETILHNTTMMPNEILILKQKLKLPNMKNWHILKLKFQFFMVNIFQTVIHAIMHFELTQN